MKWAYHVKDKIKAAGVLAIIMVVILFSNISDRKSFSALGNSVTSIYQDRLMPSSYIFEITDRLYKKRLLQEHATHYNAAPLTNTGQAYDREIATLIKEYEATVLTKQEKQKWIQFKNSLYQYNTLSANTGFTTQATQSFDQTIQYLGALNKIQVGEGNSLRKSSQTIIDGSSILSYLEIVSLIVLGIFTLILLSVADTTLLKKPENHVWN